MSRDSAPVSAEPPAGGQDAAAGDLIAAPAAGPWALLRRTCLLAFPAILENLFSSLVFLVDALMVAQVGPAALAAAGIASVVFWRARFMGGAMHIAFAAMVSRRWGAGNYAEASLLHTHGAVLGFVIGCAMLPLYFLAWWIFATLAARGEVLELVVPYFQVVLLAWPMRLANFHMASTMRAAGDTRTPLLTTVVMNIVNIACNYIFIFGFGIIPAMGLYGAGLGTAISILVEFILLVALSYRGRNLRATHHGDDHRSAPQERHRLGFVPGGFRLWQPGQTGRAIKLTIPVLGEELLVSVGFLTFIGMIASLGEAALASHTAALRMESFSFNFGWGIAVATSALVGQFLGAGAPEKAMRMFTMSLSLVLAAMGIIGIGFALIPDWCLSWFLGNADTATMNVAREIFLLTMLAQPVTGAGMVLAQGLRGAGYTKAPFLSNLLGTVIMRIGAGYYFCFVLEWGLVGIYWATMLDWTARSVVLGIIVWRGKWVHAKVG